jgi:hypothetical protein
LPWLRQRDEIIDHGLNDKDVAVGERQDALFPACFPQAPDNLKRRVGLAGAGRHDKQYAVLALGDGFNRGIYGAGLVVARALAAAVIKVILEHDLVGLRRKPLPSAIPVPQGAWFS